MMSQPNKTKFGYYDVRVKYYSFKMFVINLIQSCDFLLYVTFISLELGYLVLILINLV